MSEALDIAKEALRIVNELQEDRDRQEKIIALYKDMVAKQQLLIEAIRRQHQADKDILDYIHSTYSYESAPSCN